MGQGQRSVQFVVEESEASEYVRSIEAGEGVVTREEGWDVPAELLDEYGDAQFEPFMLIAAVVSIGFLVKRISDVWADHTRPGGQVVDARSEELVVRHAPYVKRGTLVVVTPEGATVYEPDERDRALDVVARLASGGG